MPRAQTRPPVGRPTPTARRRPEAAEPWTRHQGGLDALPEQHRAAAQASYKRWTQARPELAQRHPLADYVAYVQDRRRDQDQEDDAPATPAADGIGPASRVDAEAQRRAHLVALLADRYVQPAALAGLVRRVTVDAEARTATLHLPGGARVVDHGDRLTHEGPLTPEAARATAAAAAARGWDRVSLTGSAAYRDAVGEACALRTPPIATDHGLSRAAADRVATAMRERAAAAVPPLDVAAVHATAATDPAAAAVQVLAHAEARARAALAGRPQGTTDPRELSRPLVADLIQRRDQAAEDAHEALAAAAAHRQAHGWTARLLDPAARRRQAALDDEAHRLDSDARRLDRGHERAVRRVDDDARRQATAAAAALEDWRWSRPVRAADAVLAQVAHVRAAVQAGEPDAVASAARGDLRGAALATEAAQQVRARAGTGQVDPRTQAVHNLVSAERAAGDDPRALAAARAVTAAALVGDPATVEAAARGDYAAAQVAATDHQRRLAEQAAAVEAGRAAHQQAGPEPRAMYAPG